MATSRSWANALIIGCTVVVAYAALVLAMIHAHRAHERHGAMVAGGSGEPHHPHGGPHHPHGGPHHHGDGEQPPPPCPVEQFAWLSIATGLTGIFAACSLKRRWLYVFPVVLLLTELCVLTRMSHRAARSVHECAERAERVAAVIEVDRVNIAPGIAVQRERAMVSQPFVDEMARERCVEGVRHGVVMGSLIVGIICSALMCCGSRLAAALEREEAAAAAACDVSPTAGVVVVAHGGCSAADDEEEQAPLMQKADPLAADMAEVSSHGRMNL